MLPTCLFILPPTKLMSLFMKKSWICRGSKGISHPPTENYGRKCSLQSCPNQRFSSWIVWPTSGLGLATACILLFLFFSPKPHPLLFLHIVDISASAVNEHNKDFRQSFQQTCKGKANASKKKFDSSLYITVDSQAHNPEDRRLVQSPDEFLEDCQKRLPRMPRPLAERGTNVCSAWVEASRTIKSLSQNARPIVITQVHADELEPFCPGKLDNFYKILIDKNGFHFLAGITNDGSFEAGLNKKLRDYIADFDGKVDTDDEKVAPRTMFISRNPEMCIKAVSDAMRYDREIDSNTVKC